MCTLLVFQPSHTRLPRTPHQLSPIYRFSYIPRGHQSLPVTKTEKKSKHCTLYRIRCLYAIGFTNINKWADKSINELNKGKRGKKLKNCSLFTAKQTILLSETYVWYLMHFIWKTNFVCLPNLWTQFCI